MPLKREDIYEELKRNPNNVRFDKLCKSVELFGFGFKGGRGSHRIYVRDGIKEMLNFQNVKGKAKPYQIKQFMSVIDKYRLLEEKDE